MIVENTEKILGADVQAYVSLDVSADSPAVKKLMVGLDNEAAARQITLPSEGDGREGMTPVMSDWYLGNVAHYRACAISEAEHVAHSITIGTNTAGVLLQKEEDRIRRQEAVRRAQEYSQFYEDNRALLNERQKADADYEAMKGEEGGRDANVPNRFLEWGVLLPLVMTPEGMLNFESFRRVPIVQSDFQALALTLGVGGGLALSAFLLGVLACQWGYFMQADNAERNKRGWKRFIQGILLLFFALAVVAYARSYYLRPLVEQALILGQTPPSIPLQTTGMLLGNIIFFLMGAAFTFLLNDPNPEFSDKARLLKDLKTKELKLRKTKLGNQLARLRERHLGDLDAVRRKAAQMNNRPEFPRLRTQVNAITGKDNEVISALTTYRTHLAQRLQQSQPTFKFEQHSAAGDLIEAKKISPAEYQAVPIHLPWGQS